MNITIHHTNLFGGDVAQRLKEIIKRLGIGHLIFEAHYGGLSHDLTMRSIELTGKKCCCKELQ
jgi:hypothetical protein